LALQPFRVIEARRADVNANDTRGGPAEGVPGGLPRPASGDQDFRIGAKGSVRPQQVVLGAMAIFVPPLVTSPIQVGDRGRIWMTGIELAHRIGAQIWCASISIAF
jgi:hypothetical protein